MLIAAILLIVVSALWIALKCKAAYGSFGGRQPVTVYDAATWPPFMIAAASFCISSAYELGWATWVYMIVWVVSVVGIIGLLKLCTIMGDKPLC